MGRRLSEGRAPLLEVRGLTKQFGGTYALREADLRVLPGQLHGLVGENGSGKSTLVKLLAGIYMPDSGSVSCRGEPVPIPLTPAAASRTGLRFVHQDLGLVETMTVLENIVGAGAYQTGRFHNIKWGLERRRTQHLLDRFEVRTSPESLVGDLSGAERAMVAVLRAVRAGEDQESEEQGERGVYVLDEPTSYLSTYESGRLIRFLERVAAAGNGVLLVSHHLSEIVSSCTWITVLRDGRVTWSNPGGQVTDRELAALMTGGRKEVGPTQGIAPRVGERRRSAVTPPRLVAHAITAGPVKDISLTIGRGEVVGITGLDGTGYEQVLQILFGLHRSPIKVSVDGKTYIIRSPADAIRAGLAFVPQDRLRHGIIAGASVRENVSLPMLNSLSSHGLLRLNRENEFATDLIQRFRVQPPRGAFRIGLLSGGNQQKAVVGKWLSTKPRVLLLAQPTQGVDIASRQAIYGYVRAFASRGLSVLVASNDFEELSQLCDRAIVLRRDGNLREIGGDSVSEESIAQHCHLSA